MHSIKAIFIEKCVQLSLYKAKKALDMTKNEHHSIITVFEYVLFQLWIISMNMNTLSLHKSNNIISYFEISVLKEINII